CDPKMTLAASSFNTAMHWRSDQMSLRFHFEQVFGEERFHIRAGVADGDLDRRAVTNFEEKVAVCKRVQTMTYAEAGAARAKALGSGNNFGLRGHVDGTRWFVED